MNILALFRHVIPVAAANIVFSAGLFLPQSSQAGSLNPPPNSDTRLLENGVTQTNTVSVTDTDYYRFNVSPGAVSALFEVAPVDGDVGLVLRYGLPWPSATDFDFRSDVPGAAKESILVTDISNPVWLQPGDWLVGVINNSSNPARYSLLASEVIDPNINVVGLTNAVPRDFTLADGTGMTNFFLFKVLDPIESVKFELFNLTGDADLLMGWDALPSPTAYFIREPVASSQPVAVELLTNTIPDLRGNWILAVINKQAGDLTFTVQASFLVGTHPAPSSEITLRNPALRQEGSLQFEWDAEPGTSYRVESTTNLAPVVQWTLITNVVPAVTPAVFADPTPVAGDAMGFYRVSKP